MARSTNTTPGSRATGGLTDAEKQAIVGFSFEFPLEGYRRLTFMMLDRDVVAASPSSVYRVLKAAGRIGRSTNKPSKKGTGFQQPQKPHEHWHIDISYVNIHGTFYYLTTILDGYSRYVVHWEIRPSMTEQDELVVLQRAKEKFPTERPRIISDNGSQFLAKDFKEFIRICGMTHVRTSPYYPQSKDHASSCTSLVRSMTIGVKGRRSERLCPCCLTGPSCSTGLNRYCCLAL
jgi:transposase InsO family protein